MKQYFKIAVSILLISVLPVMVISAESNKKKEYDILIKEYSVKLQEYLKLGREQDVPSVVLDRRGMELGELELKIVQFAERCNLDLATFDEARSRVVSSDGVAEKNKNTFDVVDSFDNNSDEAPDDLLLGITEKSRSEAKSVNPDEEVSLTVSSDGPTKDEALKNALRTAIEQAYGAFVSANTTILNDELVKDEIVTVSNGSIKDYKEVSSFEKTDGSGYMITVNATVSLPHLIKYAKNHGSECEFAGNTFMLNSKLKKIYQENEIRTLNNLYTVICEILPTIYDYDLIIPDEPYESGGNYAFKSKIIAKLNSNSQALWEIITQNISELSTEPDLKDKYFFNTLNPEEKNIFVMTYKNTRFYASGLLHKRYGLSDSGPYGYDNGSYPSQNSDILCAGFLRTNPKEMLNKIVSLIDATITSINIVSNTGDILELDYRFDGAHTGRRYHPNHYSSITPNIPETVEMSCIFYVHKDKLSQISSIKVVPKSK